MKLVNELIKAAKEASPTDSSERSQRLAQELDSPVRDTTAIFKYGPFATLDDILCAIKSFQRRQFTDTYLNSLMSTPSADLTVAAQTATPATPSPLMKTCERCSCRIPANWHPHRACSKYSKEELATFFAVTRERMSRGLDLTTGAPRTTSRATSSRGNARRPKSSSKVATKGETSKENSSCPHASSVRANTGSIIMNSIPSRLQFCSVRIGQLT